MNTSAHPLVRLLVSCKDKPGIVSKVTNFLYQHGANITALDQHTSDPIDGDFFLRLEFQATKGIADKDKLFTAFKKEVVEQYAMDWHFHFAKPYKKIAILVSKHEHVLLEILWRHACQELEMEIPIVISNHPDMAHHVKHFNLPFEHIPFDSKHPESEQAVLKLIKGKVDGVVLARFMQILSPEFIQHFENKIINIHHSFLPAFIGANPYKQAFEKGVKVIGATAHYATNDLDMGPIISQDIAHVTHRLNEKKLKALGKDIEKRVLIRALKNHLEDRIIVHGNKTIVFEET